VYVTSHCSLGNFTIILQRIVTDLQTCLLSTRDQLLKEKEDEDEIEDEEEEKEGAWLGEILQERFWKFPVVPICKYDIN